MPGSAVFSGSNPFTTYYVCTPEVQNPLHAMAVREEAVRGQWAQQPWPVVGSQLI